MPMLNQAVDSQWRTHRVVEMHDNRTGPQDAVNQPFTALLPLTTQRPPPLQKQFPTKRAAAATRSTQQHPDAPPKAAVAFTNAGDESPENAPTEAQAPNVTKRQDSTQTALLLISTNAERACSFETQQRWC
jgi:hypothetical protein